MDNPQSFVIAAAYYAASVTQLDWGPLMLLLAIARRASGLVLTDASIGDLGGDIRRCERSTRRYLAKLVSEGLILTDEADSTTNQFTIAQKGVSDAVVEMPPTGDDNGVIRGMTTVSGGDDTDVTPPEVRTDEPKEVSKEEGSFCSVRPRAEKVPIDVWAQVLPEEDAVFAREAGYDPDKVLNNQLDFYSPDNGRAGLLATREVWSKRFRECVRRAQSRGWTRFQPDAVIADEPPVTILRPKFRDAEPRSNKHSWRVPSAIKMIQAADRAIAMRAAMEGV